MKNKGAKNNKGDQKQQLLFNDSLSSTRFNLQRMLVAKLDCLSSNIGSLTFSEVVWLSKIEEFFIKYDYITEKQSRIVDSILKRFFNKD